MKTYLDQPTYLCDARTLNVVLNYSDESTLPVSLPCYTDGDKIVVDAEQIKDEWHKLNDPRFDIQIQIWNQFIDWSEYHLEIIGI